MKERILIVDDEGSIRGLLHAILSQSGYECETAPGADEARAALDSRAFDLLLCDIMMPGESGLALIQHVSEAYPDTGVIMVTAVDDMDIAERALELGVYGYVVKPFEPSQILISTVNALKRRELEVRCRARQDRLEETVEERTAELRETVHNLDQARRHYRDLFEQSLDAIYVVSTEGKILEINQAGLDMLGYTREGIEGLNARGTYVLPADRKAFQERIEEAGFVRDYELRLKRSNNEEIHCLVSATVRRDKKGRIVGYQGILRDTTEQKRMEYLIRQAHLENEQILEAISSLLIGIDSEGRVIRWNASAEHTLGVPAREVLKRPFGECAIPWEREMIRDGLSRSRRYQEPVKLDDVPFRRPDGAKGVLGITLNPILFQDSREPGLLIMGADITRKRQLEIQLTQAQRLESIGQLASGIAHEINTPIQYVGDNTRFLSEAFEDLERVLEGCTALVAAVQTGEDTGEALRAVEAAAEEADLPYLREEVPAAVEQTLEGVERVSQIVRSMKAFSHPGNRETIAADLNMALESTITVSRNEWKYAAEMETDFDPTLPLVPCLPGELNQVFLNLIVNAAHAVADAADGESGGKGRIRVSTKTLGDAAEIRISDTGIGIPEKIRDRIFDPFFTTKEVGKGTGQGLAISRSVVVDKHEGSITFESEEGRGTTFIVRLPLEQGCTVGGAA
ncbi:MAG: PAS domain S-box protein [Deltaproteobacteria bacterium]|nr:PAS domain S-box protein [Deltaproteobacteria bacterium]